jgi:hypothetical protein
MWSIADWTLAVLACTMHNRGSIPSYKQAFAQFLSETAWVGTESSPMYPGGHNLARYEIAGYSGQ